jgi:hypothetical protein
MASRCCPYFAGGFLAISFTNAETVWLEAEFVAETLQLGAARGNNLGLG